MIGLPTHWRSAYGKLGYRAFKGNRVIPRRRAVSHFQCERQTFVLILFIILSVNCTASELNAIVKQKTTHVRRHMCSADSYVWCAVRERAAEGGIR